MKRFLGAGMALLVGDVGGRNGVRDGLLAVAGRLLSRVLFELVLCLLGCMSGDARTLF